MSSSLHRPRGPPPLSVTDAEAGVPAPPLELSISRPMARVEVSRADLETFLSSLDDDTGSRPAALAALQGLDAAPFDDDEAPPLPIAAAPRTSEIEVADDMIEGSLSVVDAVDLGGIDASDVVAPEGVELETRVDERPVFSATPSRAGRKPVDPGSSLPLDWRLLSREPRLLDAARARFERELDVSPQRAFENALALRWCSDVGNDILLAKTTRLLRLACLLGADPNRRAGDDQPLPLLAAIDKNDVEAARVLLDHGAEVNPAFVGAHPLHRAARQTPLVTLLLERGADPRLLDDNGTSPLEACARGGNSDGARALVAAGVNPDLPVWDPLSSPRTLFARASSRGDRMALRVLFDVRARPELSSFRPAPRALAPRAVARALERAHSAFDQATDASLAFLGAALGRELVRAPDDVAQHGAPRRSRALAALHRFALALRDHARDTDVALLRAGPVRAIEVTDGPSRFERPGGVVRLGTRDTARQMLEGVLHGLAPDGRAAERPLARPARAEPHTELGTAPRAIRAQVAAVVVDLLALIEDMLGMTPVASLSRVPNHALFHSADVLAGLVIVAHGGEARRLAALGL